MYTGIDLLFLFTPSTLAGRGGWVWTRNFELDSVAYFFNFLWNYHQTQGLWKPGALLAETTVWGGERGGMQHGVELVPPVPGAVAPGGGQMRLRATEGRGPRLHCFPIVIPSSGVPLTVPAPHSSGVPTPAPLLGA